MHKIITITGNDCAGKETQSRLLTRALSPSQRMTFPDYDHWGGRLVRAILREKAFTLGLEGEDWRTVHFQHKDPYIFQMLQSVDRVAAQAEIVKGLESHHWIMDRYEIDALAYGLVDGCSLAWLEAMKRLYRPSDQIIVLVGRGFPRPGETPDLNERDPRFQHRVTHAYQSLKDRYGEWITLIDVDDYRREDPVESMYLIHQEIRAGLKDGLDLSFPCLSPEEIRETLRT